MMSELGVGSEFAVKFENQLLIHRLAVLWGCMGRAVFRVYERFPLKICLGYVRETCAGCSCASCVMCQNVQFGLNLLLDSRVSC